MYKSKIEDLSIFGGRKTFDLPLHVGRPNIVDRQQFLQHINTILDTKWLTNNGPYVQNFEHKISDITGVKHAIAICNGTVALEIAIRALELTGEVIVPSFTFVATAHALQWQEITPVFCDINLDNFTIDTQQIEKLITPRTSGIIGVNLWGRNCHTAALSELAEKYNLKLLYDSAHSFGCTNEGTMVGNFGDAEIFSFHATKMVNTLEGGAIVTNNDELAEKIRLMRNFGFADEDKVIYIGTNGKMNEISAAMGLCSLDNIETIINANKQNYSLYTDGLSDIPGIKICEYTSESTYPYITLYIDHEQSVLTRNQLVDILQHDNILARRYFYPGCHNMEPYRSYFPHSGLLLKNTENLIHQTLCLPTGTSISKNEIEETCHLIKFIINNAKEIKKKLEYKNT